jgi:hypothetical protein
VRIFAGAAFAGLFIGWLGPLGTHDIPLGVRVFYGTSISLIGAVIVWPVVGLGLHIGRRRGWPPWLCGLASGLFLSAPIWLLAHQTAPVLWLGHAPPASSEWGSYFEVLIFMLPTGLTAALVIRPPRAAPGLREPPAIDAVARLYRQLPVALGREVLALQAEDHYVRVHTPRGSALLLMRLADAVSDVGGLEGMRVHRSWWVAKDAIGSSRLEGRRLTLALTNGLSVPVTREAAPVLRRAGWL